MGSGQQRSLSAQVLAAPGTAVGRFVGELFTERVTQTRLKDLPEPRDAHLPQKILSPGRNASPTIPLFPIVRGDASQGNGLRPAAALRAAFFRFARGPAGPHLALCVAKAPQQARVPTRFADYHPVRNQRSEERRVGK